MRSRTVREGSVGLLVLFGLGLFAGLILWLRGFNPANRSFKVQIDFEQIAGLQVGAPVRYRGVTVGRITEIRPGPNNVEVEVEISPADIIIPRNVTINANQSGLISQTSIDIVPLVNNPLNTTVSAKPLDPNCDSALILCDGSRLQGAVGISVDELVRSTVKFATIYTDPQFFTNVNSVIKNSSDAAAEIAKLSREFNLLTRSVRGNLGTFTYTAQATGRAAEQIGLTAAQVSGLLTSNRRSIVATLDNLSQTSGQLRSTVLGFQTVLTRVDQGEILRNLEVLSANAAQASANLRDVSKGLNNPANLVVLQQTLDSARATFQNVQKITSDVDELTGDPKFRDNLRNLVNGLSNLVSSSQQLYHQAQLAQVLEPIAVDPENPKQMPAITPPAAIPTPTPTPTASPSPKPQAEGF